MKTFLTFLLFCFFSSNIYSQEIPWVNVGVGYPFITSKTDYSVGEVYADGATFNLFTEVPFLIKLKIKPEFVISPGISYVRLQVSQEGGGLGGGSNGKFDRKSVSVYTKLQYSPNFNFTGNNNWNLGLVTGYYLNTKVEGKFEWWHIQDGPAYHGSKDIDGNSKDFFKSFYFGFVSSFQFNLKKVRFLKPAIELSFYPNYANIAADYSSSNDIQANRNMIMGSMIIGFGSKGISQKSEK